MDSSDLLRTCAITANCYIYNATRCGMHDQFAKPQRTKFSRESMRCIHQSHADYTTIATLPGFPSNNV